MFDVLALVVLAREIVAEFVLAVVTIIINRACNLRILCHCSRNAVKH